MKRRKITEDDIRNASKALVGWFESQDLTDKESVPVMALTIALILVERFHDAVPAQEIIRKMIASAVDELNNCEGEP